LDSKGESKATAEEIYETEKQCKQIKIVKEGFFTRQSQCESFEARSER
jgi:hypothetical protein